jgi:PAS domain S-box-containing protein
MPRLTAARARCDLAPVPPSEPQWSLGDVASILDMLFGESSIGIAFHDRNLRFTYVNDALARVGRVRPAACMGRPFSEAIPAAAAVEPYLRTVIASGSPLLDQPFSDGRRHWLVSYYPVRDPNGNVVGVGSVVRDTTAHVVGERLRAETFVRYRAFLELCPDAIAIVEDARVVFVNPAAVALIGAASAQDLIGKPIWDFIHPDDLEVSRKTYAEVLASHVRLLEPRLRRLDGTERIVQVQVATYDELGPSTLHAVIRDVTDQRRAESAREQALQQLELERTLLQTILRELPVGVVVFAPDGRFLFANDAASNIWGTRLGTRAEPVDAEPATVRTRHGRLIPPAQLRVVQAIREGTRADDLAIETLGGDDRLRSLRGSIAPLTGTDGSRQGAIATFWDVTALAQAESELRRAHDELEIRVTERTARLAEALEHLRHEIGERERAQEQLRTAERLTALGTFAAGVAHEINNPFAGILASAELGRALNADGASRAEVDATLARIAAEARRGGEIVRSVLRFARSEKSERVPVDLNELARETCRSARTDGLLNGSALHTRLAREVPHVPLNRTEVEQVLLNLLRNAAQAGAKEIVVRTARRGGHVYVVVRDDGVGIARHHLPRIFDPFFTTREGEGGSGLGLTVAHGIVSRHDGTLRVQSKVGAGTTFTITLPIDGSDDVAMGAGA